MTLNAGTCLRDNFVKVDTKVIVYYQGNSAAVLYLAFLFGYYCILSCTKHISRMIEYTESRELCLLAQYNNVDPCCMTNGTLYSRGIVYTVYLIVQSYTTKQPQFGSSFSVHCSK